MRPNGWKLKGFDSETYLGVISRIRMVDIIYVMMSFMMW